jgi:transmembrane sensor
MNSTPSRERDLVAQDAADWFLANRGLLSAEERARFTGWLTASPLHVDEYLRIALIAHSLPQACASARLARTATATGPNADAGSRPPRGERRRGRARTWSAAAALAAAAAALTFAFLHGAWNHATPTARQFHTRHGQQLNERLEDGTLLRLNTDTEVTVQYTPEERVVRVARGEAVFEVEHDPQRPFRVSAGPAAIVAVGTAFDVYLRLDGTLVTVLDGRVSITALVAPPGRVPGGRDTVLVEAGEQVRVSADAWPTRPHGASVQHTTSWLTHAIVFKDEPLGQVVDEYNRYAAVPIVIDTAALSALHISGSFSTEDTRAFLAFLRSLDRVQLEITSTAVHVRSSSAVSPQR